MSDWLSVNSGFRKGIVLLRWRLTSETLELTTDSVDLL